jgi:hypothetical protein
MISGEIAKAIRQRYPKVHPLIFQRCLDRANNNSELFDMLDSLPKGFPIIWSEVEHSWIKEADIFLAKKFNLER